MMKKIHKIRYKGFTLAELLIALAILGVIATFTIPKVLQAQQDNKNNAIAKETAAVLSDALQQHRNKGLLSATTYNSDLTQYLNYVAVQTFPDVDSNPGGTTIPCSTNRCVRLHNGAVLHWWNCQAFGGTASTNATYFELDPDGVFNNIQAVQFWLYYNGKVRTSWTVEPNTNFNDCGTPATFQPAVSADPPWFSWNK